jgi:hypothetical protein
LPLLTSEEASRVCTDVHAQRAHWRPRHPTRPFFTLGTASYLDAREGRLADYQAHARYSNAILRAQFGPLLERLRIAVATYVGGQAVYDDRLALPGFHIFLFDAAFRQSSAGSHFDLQHELIDWTHIGSPDASAQLSLTLALALPVAGGGLLVWNIDRRELEQMTEEARIAHARANRFATRTRYAVGSLAIHSGYQLHQIESNPDLQPGDERITMQAHAMPVDGRWIIYW